ncbi:Cytochrome P450 26B1 [Tetrabaena socialis]|uniref:Cytochrome P450 26B1 n=1 Tax=Tetrabaena socialis TaxID=47790 RepID=A0A2J8AHN6_9CHLO|nr:Cytochrome P450 26B1 [Tetrabaena socialis]|eukprot:PNH12011.1 Cytochrome P450 26B1 [Tetrabaena socialis]
MVSGLVSSDVEDTEGSEEEDAEDSGGDSDGSGSSGSGGARGGGGGGAGPRPGLAGGRVAAAAGLAQRALVPGMPRCASADNFQLLTSLEDGRTAAAGGGEGSSTLSAAAAAAARPGPRDAAALPPLLSSPLGRTTPGGPATSSRPTSAHTPAPQQSSPPPPEGGFFLSGASAAAAAAAVAKPARRGDENFMEERAGVARADLGSDVPVIMLSARQNESAVVEGLKCGANTYVTKPFSEGVGRQPRMKGKAPQALATALACAVVATAALLLLGARWRSTAGLRLPPGEMEWPVGGLRYLTNGFSTLCAYEGDGPRKMRLVETPTVLVRQLDQVKKVLAGDGDIVEVSWIRSTQTMLGRRSVTFAKGAYHRALRRLLGPCFTHQAIEGYLPAIQRICERFCSEWAAATEAAEWAAAAGGAAAVAAGEQRRQHEQQQLKGGDGTELPCLPRMQDEARLLTFEVMSRVVAGFDFSRPQLRRLSAAFDLVTRGIFVPLPLPLPGTRYGRAIAARKVIVAALNEQIDAFSNSNSSSRSSSNNGAARGGGKEGGGGGSASDVGSGGSVMERLLGMRDNEGQPLSRVALQDLSINLLFAGHETTATSIVRLLLRLRHLPDVLARLRAEQLAVVAAHGDAITGAAMRDMPYLDAVVKEAWRIDPIVPMVPRRATRRFQLNGFDVPQGWGLALGLAQPLTEIPAWRGLPEGDPMHPRAFNPGRWHITSAASTAAATAQPPPSPQQISTPIGMLPPQMLTFGGGARTCLGSNLAWAEIKVFVSVLLRTYEVSFPLESMEVKLFPTVSISGGFPVKVRALQPTATA